MTKRIPVILDTDLGTDIDDTWALAMLLKSPELDVKLIVSATGDVVLRAKMIAKLLETAGRTDIPIGIGLPDRVVCKHYQEGWVADYNLARYPGRVLTDGVKAMIDVILGSAEPVTLLCIGPVPNIAEALARAPQIAERTRFVGMHGSVRKGYGGQPPAAKEYNVVVDVPSCQTVFAAPWDMTITPLDTCGVIRLTGARYAAVRACTDPLVRAVIEGYDIWCRACGSEDFQTRSSILFDTVAVFLAFREDLLEMERLGIRVTDDGFTEIDEHAKVVNCAMGWKDLGKFEDFLLARLTGRA